MRDDQRQILRLAVPSDLPGGLDAARSGHFGRSPSFTIVDIVDDVVVNTFMVPNQPHAKGDHGLTQVLTLGENSVDVVIVAGIGSRAAAHLPAGRHARVRRRGPVRPCAR